MPENVNVRNLRLTKKLSQAQLAALADINLSEVRKIERGLACLDVHQAERLAALFDVSSEELLSAHGEALSNPLVGEGYVTLVCNQSAVFPREKTPPDSKWKVLDLFCGCGGMSYGFEQTGDFVVTAGLDLLTDRIETFRSNHTFADAIVGDIRTIAKDELIRRALFPDVIVGGPPCQGFSSIRPFRTLTEGDPRNSLIEEFVAVVGIAQPKWFVFENVVGLLTHQKGSVFESLLKSFHEAGYSTDWRVINVALLGLPQARVRVVIVGSKSGEVFPWPVATHDWPNKGMAGKKAKRLDTSSLFTGYLQPAISVMDAIGDLPSISSGDKSVVYGNFAELTDYAREMRDGSTKLTLHEATRHNEKMMSIIRVAGKTRGDLPVGLATSGFSSSYSRLDADKPSVTLTVNFVHPASNRCIHPFQDRALTPREGARLQGFPDKFIFAGSRAQIVKQIGNAVPPLLGKKIAEQLAQALRSKRQEAA